MKAELNKYTSTENKSYKLDKQDFKVQKINKHFQYSSKMNFILKTKFAEQSEQIKNEKIRIIEDKDSDPMWFVRFNNFVFEKLSKNDCKGNLLSIIY